MVSLFVASYVPSVDLDTVSVMTLPVACAAACCSVAGGGGGRFTTFSTFSGCAVSSRVRSMTELGAVVVGTVLAEGGMI